MPSSSNIGSHPFASTTTTLAHSTPSIIGSANTPGKKNKTEHRRTAEGRARGRTPLGFGSTMIFGRLVVCGARGGRGKALFAMGLRARDLG